MTKTTEKAIDTVHTMALPDGRVITTTWHDTLEEAQARINTPATASFRAVFPGGVLGLYRAVTWSVA